jgi:hypothetical protein
VDIQPNDAHACSLRLGFLQRELAGDTTSTDPRSRRIRESRKGRPCNELGLSAHGLWTACPHFRAPGAPCPGWAHHIAGSLPGTAGQRGAADLIPDKGKVERPFRYIREDFFLAGAFRNLDDLNDQLRHWLDTVANPRVHATTHRIVNEAFAEERASLKALPTVPYRAVLRLERRASHEGMVSIGGNLYSVPDTTRRRVFDVHVLADEIRVFEDGAIVATHAPLEGRGEKRLDPSHRKPVSSGRRGQRNEPLVLIRAGDRVVPRSLDFYAAVGRRLARLGSAR